MTPSINAALTNIREKLQEDASESDAGPHSHLAGEPGSGKADNIVDANDAIDKYLADIVDQLVLSYDMDADEAFDFVFDMADSASSEEHLPALPGEDADPEELMMWLGKANTMGFGAKVISAAKHA